METFASIPSNKFLTDVALIFSGQNEYVSEQC